MPTLHFNNGGSKLVDYSIATSIRETKQTGMIHGKKAAHEQVAYAATVADISYEDLPSQKRREQFVIREHDTVMDEILDDYTLKGRKKLKAVVDRIKDRQAQS